MTKRSLKVLTIVCGVLSAGSIAGAQTPGGACTDRILRGDYGFSIEGVLNPAPGVTLQLRGVAMTTFNGDGTLTQVDHVVVAGVPPPALEWTPGTGTYHVNPDCTGTAHINVPSTGEFVNLRFVVIANGSQIHTVVAPPYDLGGLERAVSSVGYRRDN